MEKMEEITTGLQEQRAPCDDEPGHRQQVPAFRCSGLDPGLRQAIEIAMLFSDPRGSLSNLRLAVPVDVVALRAA
jgi:hypothetical protein